MTYRIDNLIEYDLEVYPNYFLAGFRLPDASIRQYDHTQLAELREFLAWVQQSGHELCGYNSRYYDDLVLSNTLLQGTVRAAYETSCAIIYDDLKPWNCDLLVESVDLMPVLPGRNSLKKLGVCLGHDRLQELPFDPHRDLTPEEQAVIRSYNINDLEITHKLRVALHGDLDLRARLSEQYGLDLRSSGEAQIAEKVLLKQSGLNGKQLKQAARDRVMMDPSITIRPPSWWDRLPVERYPGLTNVKRIGEDIFNTRLQVTANFQLPEKAFARTVYLGDRYYNMGVGGLHSVDGPGCWKPGVGEAMSDWDFASYYPSIILQERLEPLQWSGAFLPVYEGIVNRRLQAKRNKDKVTADILKITINGSFGKFGDQFSALYDPEMLAHVTVYGQLGLLALVAMLTDAGHKVVSANTDGLTCVNQANNPMLPVIREFESLTGMVMEETQYQALYQQNVNNYVAITTEGKLKTKGALTPEGDLRHSPNALVVAKAVCEYLKAGTPVEETIRASGDINDFILTTQVRGDWAVTWGEMPLGKMVRFYKSNQPDLPEIIRTPLGAHVKGNQGRVPEGNNAVPVPDLPETFPADVDYAWYQAKAEAIMAEVQRPKVYGNNALAEFLYILGLEPVEVDPTAKRRSRAKLDRCDMDFDAMAPGNVIGVRTGREAGILAQVFVGGRRNGDVDLWLTDREYPSRTRDKVKKDHDFELLYGANVELASVLPLPSIFMDTGGYDLDNFYTEAELRGVGR